VEVRYNTARFEDVFITAEEIARFYNCPIVLKMAHYQSVRDVRSQFSEAVRRAFHRLFWDLRDHYERRPTKTIEPPSFDTLQGYFDLEVSQIPLPELMLTQDLASHITAFSPRLERTYKFIVEKCAQGMKPTLVGYGPIETAIGNKFTLQYTVDLLYTVDEQEELLILAEPFTDDWIYRALAGALQKGLVAQGMKPTAYVCTHRKNPLMVTEEREEDSRQLESLFWSYYRSEIADELPLGEQFRAGKMRGCGLCVYRSTCSTVRPGGLVGRMDALKA